MRILFHTIALNRCDLLKQTIDSIDTEYEWDLLLHFVSKDPEITEYIRSAKIAPKARSEFICNIGYNIGVAYCFNEALFAGYEKGDYDYVFLINSDIRFHPGDIDGMISLAQEAQHKAFITVSGPHGRHGEDWDYSHGLAATILMPGAFRDAGYFDENIFPAYFEDCDYFNRIRLARCIESTGITHTLDDIVNPLIACFMPGNTYHEGSSVIYSDGRMEKLNPYFFVRNRNYYVSKWGGINYEEKYSTPFREIESMRIDHESRARPYGKKFDRSTERRFYLAFAKNRSSFHLALLKGYNSLNR
ncbi:MAG: hypothetical protein KAR44_05585 [Candidatus Aegiribacteria sp.]|nr:hypothetical protein [Candidatus Aegiribacteria sp.]